MISCLCLIHSLSFIVALNMAALSHMPASARTAAVLKTAVKQTHSNSAYKDHNSSSGKNVMVPFCSDNSYRKIYLKSCLPDSKTKYYSAVETQVRRASRITHKKYQCLVVKIHQALGHMCDKTVHSIAR
jgi:hypothetical protein